MMPKRDSIRILESILKMENRIKGDIKKLTNFTPEYRLRVGNYRILFQIEDENIVVYRVLHRKNSYR